MTFTDEQRWAFLRDNCKRGFGYYSLPRFEIHDEETFTAVIDAEMLRRGLVPGSARVVGNLSFEGDGKVSASVDSIVQSEGFQSQLQATREIAGDVERSPRATALEEAAEVCDEHQRTALCVGTPTGDAMADALMIAARGIRRLVREAPPVVEFPSEPTPKMVTVGLMDESGLICRTEAEVRHIYRVMRAAAAHAPKMACQHDYQTKLGQGYHCTHCGLTPTEAAKLDAASEVGKP